LGNRDAVARAVAQLKEAGIAVSLFIDPDEAQIVASAELGAEAIELHTGAYALATGEKQQEELAALTNAGRRVQELNMALHAGHGLTCRNVRPVAEIAGMRELNIGHSIVSRAVMIGMDRAVREMKALVGGK